MIWYDWMIIRGVFCILLYPSTWSNLSIVVQSSSQWDGGSAGQPCWRHAETQRKPNCMFLWKMHLRLMTTIWSPTGDSEKRFRKKDSGKLRLDMTWIDLTFPAILGTFGTLLSTWILEDARPRVQKGSTCSSARGQRGVPGAQGGDLYTWHWRVGSGGSHGWCFRCIYSFIYGRWWDIMGTIYIYLFLYIHIYIFNYIYI